MEVVYGYIPVANNKVTILGCTVTHIGSSSYLIKFLYVSVLVLETGTGIKSTGTGIILVPILRTGTMLIYTHNDTNLSHD